METVIGEDIINLIKENKHNKAYKLLKNSNQSEIFRFLKSRWRFLDKNDLQVIYDEYYMIFCNKILEGNFHYKNDKALLSYFRHGCRLESRKYIIRQKVLKYRNLFVLVPDNFELIRNELLNTFDQATNDFIKEKEELLGIRIDLGHGQQDRKQAIINEVMRLYLTLRERCKLLNYLGSQVQLPQEKFYSDVLILSEKRLNNYSRQHIFLIYKYRKIR